MTRTPGQQASQKQEKSVAADNNGQTTPGSGNTWRKKNDVVSPRFSFECKTTSKGSYSMKRSELETAEKNALADGLDMVWVTDLGGKRYYTVRDYTWEMLRGD